MPVQLPLPLKPRQHFRREDFLVGPGNAQAVAFLDAWPNWPAPAAVLYGPSGAGKTHLAQVWAELTGAAVFEAAAVDDTAEIPRAPVAIENVVLPDDALERTLFALIERSQPLLMTATEPPERWQVQLPDMVSRCRAMLSFPLWAPDEDLLESLAEKLFAVRQLSVPKAVITEMIRSLERSPKAVRDFVARADREALARHRPVSVGLVRELLACPDPADT